MTIDNACESRVGEAPSSFSITIVLAAEIEFSEATTTHFAAILQTVAATSGSGISDRKRTSGSDRTIEFKPVTKSNPTAGLISD